MQKPKQVAPLYIFFFTLFLLNACSLGPSVDFLQTKSLVGDIPEKWKEEPIIVLQDSISSTLEVSSQGNEFIEKRIQWFYVQKRNPDLLSQITVLESNSVQEKSKVNIQVYAQNGTKQTLYPKRVQAQVEDDAYLSTNQFIWIQNILQYHQGMMIRLETIRPYFKPEHISRVRIRNQFPTLSKSVTLDLPKDHEILVGLQNPENLKINFDSLQNQERVIYSIEASNVDRFRGRDILAPEVSESALNFSLPPKGLKSYSWQELGDYYLSQFFDDNQDLLVNSWSNEFDDLLVQVMFEKVRSKIRYVADEFGIYAYVPRHANEILSKGYGDCKETSNLFYEILKRNKIKSNLVLVSTPSQIQLKKDYPSLGGFNHMIIQVDDPERGVVYYDPTVKSGDPTKSHFYLTYQKVLVLDSGKSHVDSIKESKNFKNEVFTKSEVIQENNGGWILNSKITLKGLAHINFDTYYKANLKTKTSENFLKNFLQENFEIEGKDIHIKNLNDNVTEIEFTSSFQKAWLPLDQGGFKLEFPSIYGGAGRYTSQDVIGPRVYKTFHQEDIWVLPDDFKELDTKDLSFNFSQGNWEINNNQVRRSLDRTHKVFDDKDDFMGYRKMEKKFYKGKIWK